MRVVLVELVQGEAGVVPASAAFVGALARVQEELGAAGLELDELLTDADGDFALSLARKP